MGELDKTINQSTDNNTISASDNTLSWGRLLSINPIFPHIEIQDDECLFGRNPNCNVTFNDKKISSKHCRIFRVKEEGSVDYRFNLEDFSSNGTFVNRKRVGKGNIVPIVNGNEISLTTNIESTDPTRIIYTFQDLEKLRRQEQEERENKESGYTQVDDIMTEELLQMSPIKKTPSNLDKNINIDSNNEESNNESNINTIKRTTSTTTVSSTSLSTSEPSTSSTVQQTKQSSNLSNKLKRKSSDLEDLEEDPTNKRKLKLDDEITATVTASETTPSASISTEKIETNNNNTTTSSNDNNTTTSNPTTNDNNTTATSNSELKDDGNKDQEMKDENELNISKDSNNNLNNNNNNNTPSKTTTTTSTPNKKEQDLEESIGENLICGICQDIIHKCLTLIPCMHNFCISCYGDWRVKSTICPSCRSDVKMYQANHAINNLIELYLKKNPEKSRDPEELKSMDERCKITEDMLKKGQLLKSKREYYDDDDDDYYSDEEEYDEEEEDEKCVLCPPNPKHTTSGFVCPADLAQHYSCSNCAELFPRVTPEPPGIRCGQCKFRVFCNYYKPCNSPNFGRMIDLPVTIIPHDTFGGNQFEIKILNDYLTKNNKTVNQLYKDLLTDIDNKKLVIPTNSNIQMPSDPVSEQLRCLYCAQGFFSRALFYYRINIPKDQLPDYAIRDNCYYGYACRTQFNKFDHSKKLNHICLQTKFN